MRLRRTGLRPPLRLLAQPRSTLPLVVVLGACHPTPTPDTTGTATPTTPTTSSTSSTSSTTTGPCTGAPLPAGFALSDATLVGSCGTFDLKLSVFQDGTFRLLADDGRASRSRGVATWPDGLAVTWSGDASGGVEACTADHVVTVTPDCRVSLHRADGSLLVDGVTPVAGGVGWALQPGDVVMGLGGRTGGLDRRGRTLVSWATDAYDPAHGGFAPDADPLYTAMPTGVTQGDAGAWAFLLDDPHRLTWDVGHSASDRLEVRSDGGPADLWLFDGPTQAEAVRRLTGVVGRPAQPPLWALGFHQCRWGYWPDARVLEVAAELRARGLPADAMWLDIQHMDGFRTFTFDPVGFPDPAGLLSTLADDGFRTVAIVDPGLKVDEAWPVYQELIAGDHALSWPDGTPFVGMAWPGASAFPDFTASSTRRWWADQVRELALLGVDGIWLDLNEPTTFPEGGGGNTVDGGVVTRGDGDPSTMSEVHNVYATLEATATVDGLLAAHPDRRPFVLSRAGYAGIQRHAATWTGDAPSTWASLSDTLPMLIGLGLSGQPLVGSDVGGYSGSADGELYARWMALGTVSPFLRAHVTNGAHDGEPWAFGPEVEAASARLLRERYAWLPLWVALAWQASATGAPFLRPLSWRFDDPTLRHVDDQALLGDHLLVAPVLQQGAQSRTFVLPEGRWFDVRTGAAFDGPATVSWPLALDTLPVLAAAGAALPVVDAAQHTGLVDWGTLVVRVFPPPSGGDAVESLVVVDPGDGPTDAVTALLWSVRTVPGGLQLVTQHLAGPQLDGTVALRLERADHPPSAVTVDGEPIGWTWDANARTALLEVPARASVVEVAMDTTLCSLVPDVTVAVQVTLPADTPEGTIHLATDLAGWSHLPMEREGLTATTSVTAPLGTLFRYKYTRGDWCTVEKDAACQELTDRTGLASAATLTDAVAAWRDLCEGC